MRHNIICEGSRSYVTLSCEDWNKLVHLFESAKNAERKFKSIDDGFFKGLIPPEFSEVSAALRALEQE